MTRRLKNHELEPVKHDISNFTWNKGTKTFTAEASSFGPVGTRWSRRLYNDACDEGFTIVNPKTGNEVTFALADVEEREGEVLAWHFHSINSRFGAIKAIIFND